MTADELRENALDLVGCGAPPSAVAIWLLVDKYARRRGWCQESSEELGFLVGRTGRMVQEIERRLCELGFLERRSVSGGRRQLRVVRDRTRRVPGHAWVPWKEEESSSTPVLFGEN